MDASRAVPLIIFLIILLLTPDTNRSSPYQQRQLGHVLDRERNDLDLLNATRYGDFDPLNNKWINVTGLRKEDGYAWHLLPKVQERAREHLMRVLEPWSKAQSSEQTIGIGDRYRSVETADGYPYTPTNASTNVDWKTLHVPFYRNITGILNGEWVRSKLEGDRGPSPVLNLTALTPERSYSSQDYNRNITGKEGELRIKLDEKKSQRYDSEQWQSSVRQIKGQITIVDETSRGDGWEFTLYGVHYPESGSVVLTTSSDKYVLLPNACHFSQVCVAHLYRFAGIFAMPHFSRSETTSNLAQQLLNRTLLKGILDQESSLYVRTSDPWSSSPGDPAEKMFPVPHCEYIVYLQQHIPSSPFPTGLQTLEEELRFPTGAAHVPCKRSIFPSDSQLIDLDAMIAMSALIFSPDCGFVLESKGPPDFAPQDADNLKGPKLESYLHYAKQCLTAFALIVGGEVYLLVRQIKDTSTPSTKSRVSFYTIAIMAVGDGLFCIGFITVGIFMDAAFLIMTSTAFLAFMSASFFGMKFLTDVWTVQAPERRERNRRNMTENNPATPAPQVVGTPTTVPTVVITPAGVDSLPLPVTARRPTDTGATPIILPLDQDLDANDTEDAAVTNGQPLTPFEVARREIGSLYSRFYFLLLIILFLSANATTWPSTIRSLYANAMAFAYLSLWAPQVYRNVMRNCRKAFRWEFVVGQSLLRLAPIAYFYMVDDNILYIKTDWIAALALVAWVWIQVWALVSQEILGPRFFIPNGWAPPAYDYHPILREDDEESGATMPLGFTQATADEGSMAITPGESRSRGHKTFDCAICMQNLEVPVVPSGGSDVEGSPSLGAGFFSRRAYMVTPCRHIFHSVCLEGWMRYRLQCPICRDNLPPL